MPRISEPSGDAEDISLLSPEEREKRRSFESKRKKHYNEFQAVKMARALMDEDESEVLRFVHIFFTPVASTSEQLSLLYFEKRIILFPGGRKVRGRRRRGSIKCGRRGRRRGKWHPNGNWPMKQYIKTFLWYLAT